MKNVLFIILVSTVFPVSNSRAEAKPQLTVFLLIKEQNYRDQLTQDKLSQYTIEGKKILISLLNDYFGFVDFREISTEDTIYFILNREKSSGPLYQVNFQIYISGIHVVTGKSPSTYWIFRSRDFWDKPLGSLEAFQQELKLTIGVNLENNYPELIGLVFSKMIITKNALLIREPTFLVIPFTKDILCVEDGTKFIFNNEFEHAIGTIIVSFNSEAKGIYDPQGVNVSKEFKRGILLEFNISENKQYLFGQDVKWKLLGVNIIEYIPFCVGTNILEVTPDEFVADEND